MKGLGIYKKLWSVGVAAGAAVLLSACGGGGGSDEDGAPAPPSTTIRGIAATGAPMALAAIDAHCQNNGKASGQADAGGAWSLQVPTANLPCAIRAVPDGGGQNHYSLATGTASEIIANVTPLTSLALAKAGQLPSDAWFNALDNAGLNTLAAAIANAVSALRALLLAQAYDIPAGFAPFTTLFTPNPDAADGYDKLLEQLARALAASAHAGFADLLADVADGGDLPAPAPDTPEPAVCETGDDRLVFTGGPQDFCGFTKAASAAPITNYYQFTSAAGANGVTWVKFNLNGNGSAVDSAVIENDKYAFACGVGTPCSGITFKTVNNHIEFLLSNSPFSVVNGASQPITVNGQLLHQISGGGGGDADKGVSGPLNVPGAEKMADFFKNIAGSHKLKVASVFSGGVSGGADDILPLNSVRDVTIQQDGSVVIQGVGKVLSYAPPQASQYSVVKATGQSSVRYLNASGRTTELNLEYIPAQGLLTASLAGFTNNQEGTAQLRSRTSLDANDKGGSATIARPVLAAGETGLRFATNGKVHGQDESNAFRYYSGSSSITAGHTGNQDWISSISINGPDNANFSLGRVPNQIGTHECGADNISVSLLYAHYDGSAYDISSDAKQLPGYTCYVTLTSVGTFSGPRFYQGTVEGYFTARLGNTSLPAGLPGSIVVSGSFRVQQQ